MKKTVIAVILFLISLVAAHASYDATAWPTDIYNINSGFGPRMNHGLTDFHEGIDIANPVGSNVYALADGQVYKTYAVSTIANPYPNLGNVVIIKHTMDVGMKLHEKTFKTYYSIYGHLNSITVRQGQYVTKGTLVGTVGQTGSASYPHLHLETRVGTTCSKEYQLKNPTTACANIFSQPEDPHVNPLLFLSYTDDASKAVRVVSESPLTLEITSTVLDINEITVDGYIINFNERIGIDPANHDNLFYNRVFITPVDSNPYNILITYPQQGYSQIIVKDILGNSVELKK